MGLKQERDLEVRQESLDRKDVIFREIHCFSVFNCKANIFIVVFE
jgi:hypothetical protein